MLNLVHIACTPLAGSPIRIVDALNRSKQVKARLVVLNPNAYGQRVFKGDLHWEKDKAESLALIAQADILHFHHYFPLAKNPFGVNFEVLNPRASKLRQFHSSAYFLGKINNCPAAEIQQSSIPQLANAQHPERYFPRARMVPNLCDIWEEPHSLLTGKPVVFFSPSVDASAWEPGYAEKRWDTKGFPEVQNILKKLRPYLQPLIVRGEAHKTCMLKRATCQMSIDDVVTGTYHLAGLESLSQGVPCLAYLDERIADNLRAMTGCNHIPFINTKLEELRFVLTGLVRDKTGLLELGVESKAWFNRYYHPDLLVSHYLRAYSDLMHNPEVFNQIRPEFNSRKSWTFLELEDFRFKVRRDQMMSFRRLMRERIISKLRAYKRKLA